MDSISPPLEFFALKSVTGKLHVKDKAIISHAMGLWTYSLISPSSASLQASPQLPTPTRSPWRACSQGSLPTPTGSPWRACSLGSLPTPTGSPWRAYSHGSLPTPPPPWSPWSPWRACSQGSLPTPTRSPWRACSQGSLPTPTGSPWRACSQGGLKTLQYYFLFNGAKWLIYKLFHYANCLFLPYNAVSSGSVQHSRYWCNCNPSPQVPSVPEIQRIALGCLDACIKECRLNEYDSSTAKCTNN